MRDPLAQTVYSDGGFECDFKLPFGQGGIYMPNWKALDPFTGFQDRLEITIGLSCWNREGTVDKCIESICEAYFPKEAYELLIVEDGSDDNSREIIRETVKKYPEHNICVFEIDNTRTFNEHFPHNLTIREARGRVFMKLSADTLISKYYLEGIWRHHQQRNNLFLTCYWGGPADNRKMEGKREFLLKVIEETNLYEDAMAPHLVHGVSEQCHAGSWPVDTGGSMLASHWKEMRGFNEQITGPRPGDVEFMCRATRKGILFGYEPNLKMFHDHITSKNHKRKVEASSPPWNPNEITKNDENYGKITEEERNKAIMTEAFKKSLEKFPCIG